MHLDKSALTSALLPAPQEKTAPARHAQRDDVQGIRGLAIASVLLFHFFPEFFPNGYLGVDVFFVISGFLIVRILGRAIEKNDGISASIIGNFYFRRLRRIVPLYYLYCLIASLLFGVLSNSLQVEAAQMSALGALAFATNIRALLHKFDYFEQVLAEDLFTHTWSLSVEIQFYLLVPFIFVLRAMMRPCCSSWALFAIVSLFSLTLHAVSDEQMSFHFLLSRLWQFFAVAFCEIDVFSSSSKVSDTEGMKVEQRASPFSRPLTLVALAALCVGFLPFFELNALQGRLFVTIAAGLLIALGEGQTAPSAVHRLLSWPPLVWLGDVSYSLYLVHWPFSVYALQRTSVFSAARLLTIPIATLISGFSYRFYECYYRDWNLSRTVRWCCFLLLATFAAILLAPQSMICHIQFRQLLPGTGNLRFLVIGNSYAPNHADLVYRQFRPFFKNFTLFSKSACEPLYITNPYAYCTRFVNFTDVIDYVKPDVTFVIQRYGAAKAPPTPPGKVDRFLKVMKQNLAEIEKRTGSLVFLMDSFAAFRFYSMLAMNDMIMKNVTADEINNITVLHNEDANARPRTQELVKSCKKCILYDIEPALIVSDAKFPLRSYDGETHLAFFEPSGHLSPWGKRKVEPIYKALAEKYADQLRKISPRKD